MHLQCYGAVVIDNVQMTLAFRGVDSLGLKFNRYCLCCNTAPGWWPVDRTSFNQHTVLHSQRSCLLWYSCGMTSYHVKSDMVLHL
jgi:hypothetical protein